MPAVNTPNAPPKTNPKNEQRRRFHWHVFQITVIGSCSNCTFWMATSEEDTPSPSCLRNSPLAWFPHYKIQDRTSRQLLLWLFLYFFLLSFSSILQDSIFNPLSLSTLSHINQSPSSSGINFANHSLDNGDIHRSHLVNTIYQLRFIVPALLIPCSNPVR